MTDVQVQMAQAKEASYRGQIDHALIVPLQAIAGMRSLGNKRDADALRARAREMLLVSLRNAADLRRLFVAESAVFHAVAFHPTRPDALLAFAGTGGKTYVASVRKPFAAKPLETCDGASLVTAIAFDPTGRWLAAGCGDGTLSVWSTDDWKPLWQENKRVFDRMIWTVAFSANGRLVAAGGYDRRIMLVALAEDGVSADQPALAAGGDEPEGDVWSLTYSPAGDTLLAGDGIGAVLVCKTDARASWKCKRSPAYPGERGKDSRELNPIRALAYSPDGTQIAVGSWKGGVEVWDASLSAKSRMSIDVAQLPGPVVSLAYFDVCGRRYLAIGKGTGLQYRLVAPNLQGSEPPAGCEVPRSASVGDETLRVAFDRPSGLLAAATRGGYVAVLDPAGTQDPLRTIVPPMATKRGRPMRGAIVAEEKSMAWLAVPIARTGLDKANLALRRLRDGQIDDGGAFVTLAAGDGEILRVSAAVHGRAPGAAPRLATLGCRRESCTGKDPYEVKVWRFVDDSFTGVTAVASLGAGDFDGLAPSRIALSPDAQWLAVSFKSNRVRLVALDGRGGRQWVPTKLRYVREIAFSGDGKAFAAGGEAMQKQLGAGVDQVQLWTVGADGFEEKPYPPMKLSSFANEVSALSFAADERGHLLLLAGGENGAIDRWDADSGDMLTTLRADSRSIYQIAYSTRTSLVAAADSQNVVRVWDTSNWIPIQLTPPGDRVEGPGFLAFGGNGAWLASGADTLQLWDLDVDSLRRKVCAVLREPGQHGADSAKPLWRRDGACSDEQPETTLLRWARLLANWLNQRPP
jgi:WD40 repeat protein